MRIMFVQLSQLKPTPGPLYHVFLGIIQWSFQLRNFQVYPTCLSVLVKELSTHLYIMFTFDDITVDLSLCYKLIYSCS